MINYKILNRYTGKAQFTAKIDCDKSEFEGLKKGLSVKWAIENDVDLTGADLSDADLSGANLFKADLFKANLEGAELRLADLTGAIK